MVPYVDYNFYKDDWKGSLENEAAFQNVAIKATYEIDCITYHNIKEITKDVKYATCAVIDTISKIQSSIAGSFGKKSESVGNLTVTYDEKLREGTDEYRNVLKEAAYPYLVNTGLLFGGVYRKNDY